MAEVERQADQEPVRRSGPDVNGTDYMETGDVIGLPGGWYLNTVTGERFRMEDPEPADDEVTEEE